MDNNSPTEVRSPRLGVAFPAAAERGHLGLPHVYHMVSSAVSVKMYISCFDQVLTVASAVGCCRNFLMISIIMSGGCCC